MSPSGAEFIRQIKAGITEIDPAAVHELIGDGATSNGGGRGVRLK